MKSKIITKVLVILLLIIGIVILLPNKFKNNNDIELVPKIMLNMTLSTEEEADIYFKNMIFNYSSFGVLVNDIEILHTLDEYKELMPIIYDMETSEITRYLNGYSIQFNNIRLPRIDIKLIYAVRTKDTSVLNENELKVYNKLFEITDELKLDTIALDIDKVKAIYDYIVLNTTYDNNTADSVKIGEVGNENSYSAVGVINDNLAVCAGYASTFRLLCEIQGINCEYAWSEPGKHGWNIVQIEGNWYHVDPTYGDMEKENSISYNYFMMTNDEVENMEQYKDWQCDCGKGHECNSSKYGVYYYLDYLVKTEDEAVDIIEKQAGNNEIRLLYRQDSGLSSIKLLKLIGVTLDLKGEVQYSSVDRFNGLYTILTMYK